MSIEEIEALLKRVEMLEKHVAKLMITIELLQSCKKQNIDINKMTFT